MTYHQHHIYRHGRIMSQVQFQDKIGTGASREYIQELLFNFCKMIYKAKVRLQHQLLLAWQETCNLVRHAQDHAGQEEAA